MIDRDLDVASDLCFTFIPLRPMQVWAVIYNPKLFSEDVRENRMVVRCALESEFEVQLYHRALGLVDLDSAARIKRFYRREDACRECNFESLSQVNTYFLKELSLGDSSPVPCSRSTEYLSVQ